MTEPPDQRHPPPPAAQTLDALVAACREMADALVRRADLSEPAADAEEPPEGGEGDSGPWRGAS